MKVDIVIPNYNGAHLVKRNLPSVIASMEKHNGKIIMVDDGSTMEDRDALREIVREEQKKGTKIELVEHPVNYGYASAVNNGVFKSSAEFVVLLNTDIVPRKDFLDNLLPKIEKDESVFAVGCMDESIEGDRIILRGRGIARWHNGFLIHSKGEVEGIDTFWASGGSSIFRRNLYVKFGGMDEIYNPFYWEDIDLSYRAKKNGYQILFNNKAIVKHFHEEGAIKKNYKRKDITKIAYRNQFIFIWKNITNSNLIINHLLYLPVNFLGALRRGDFNFVKGFFLAVVKLPAIINKRSEQKRYYKLSDIEVIKVIA